MPGPQQFLGQGRGHQTGRTLENRGPLLEGQGWGGYVCIVRDLLVVVGSQFFLFWSLLFRRYVLHNYSIDYFYLYPVFMRMASFFFGGPPDLLNAQRSTAPNNPLQHFKMLTSPYQSSTKLKTGSPKLAVVAGGEGVLPTDGRGTEAAEHSGAAPTVGLQRLVPCFGNGDARQLAGVCGLPNHDPQILALWVSHCPTFCRAQQAGRR